LLLVELHRSDVEIAVCQVESLMEQREELVRSSQALESTVAQLKAKDG